MTRRQKDPLRALTAEEQAALEQRGRARSEPASHVVRAPLVLAVAKLVARFNMAGLAALVPRHGGGAVVRSPEAARSRIRAAARRTPAPAADGTATGSRSTLRRARRVAPDGLPGVRAYTIWCVLRGAGRRWQRDRSWCATGVVVRQRQAGALVVPDPDTAPPPS